MYFLIRNPEIRREELVTLSDGTRANYGKITWRYRSFDMVTVAVAVCKDDKIIRVTGVRNEHMPTGYLAGMVKSWRLRKQKRNRGTQTPKKRALP